MFVGKATQSHGKVYDYALVEYKNAKTKVLIICTLHGTFEQKPNSHLQGAGCPVCGKEKSVYSYNPHLFKKCPESISQPATVYVLQFNNLIHTFIKIGITKQTTYERFRGTQYKDYHITTLYEASTTLWLAYTTEQEILATYKTHQFKLPLDTTFDGRTELLVNDKQLVENIINDINNKLNQQPA